MGGGFPGKDFSSGFFGGKAAFVIVCTIHRSHIYCENIHPCSTFPPLRSTTAAHIPLQALIHRKPEFVLEAGHLLKGHRREFIDTRDTTPEYSR